MGRFFYINKQFKLLKHKHFLLVLAAVLITGIIYLPGLKGGFHIDDYPNILNNDLLKIEKLNFVEAWQSAMSGNAGPLKRPISMLSFGLNTYFSGENPYYMKATNLVIHLITGVLLILVSQLILGHWKKNQLIKIDTHLLSIFIGFCWLIHPFNLTGVLYIVQRMTSLASLFAVLSIYSYCLLRSKSFSIKRGILYSALMFFSGLLSLLSKEIAILIPFQILVIELCVFRFKTQKLEEKYYLVSIFTLSTVIPFLYFIYSFITRFSAYVNAFAPREFTLYERLLTEAGIVLWYLKMTLMPNINHMGLLLDTFDISHSLINPPITIVYMSVLILLAGLALYFLNKKPFISFGIFWFYVCHSLESTIIPLELAFEHRNYLASYGVILTFIVTIVSVIKQENVKLAIGFCIIWSFALAFTTHLRVGHWEHPLKLAIYDVEHHPDSARAHMVLAELYESLYRHEEDKKLKTDLFNLSIEHLDTANKINPNSLSPKTGKLLLLARQNETPQQNELESLYRSLRFDVIDASTVNSLQELTRCVLQTNCSLDQSIYLTVFFQCVKQQ